MDPHAWPDTREFSARYLDGYNELLVLERSRDHQASEIQRWSAAFDRCLNDKVSCEEQLHHCRDLYNNEVVGHTETKRNLEQMRQAKQEQARVFQGQAAEAEEGRKGFERELATARIKLTSLRRDKRVADVNAAGLGVVVQRLSDEADFKDRRIQQLEAELSQLKTKAHTDCTERFGLRSDLEEERDKVRLLGTGFTKALSSALRLQSSLYRARDQQSDTEDRHRSAATELGEAAGRLETTQQELAQLLATNTATISERDALKTANGRLQKTVSKLSSDLEVAKRKVNDLTKQSTTLLGAVDVLKKRLTESEDWCQEAEQTAMSKIEKLQDRLRRCLDEDRDLHRMNQDAQKDLATLRAKLKGMEEQAGRNDAAIADLRSSKEQMDATCDRVNKNSNILALTAISQRRQTAALERRINYLRTEVHQAQGERDRAIERYVAAQKAREQAVLAEHIEMQKYLGDTGSQVVMAGTRFLTDATKREECRDAQPGAQGRSRMQYAAGGDSRLRRCRTVEAEDESVRLGKRRRGGND